jgi:hypothetical protein
MQVSAVPAEYVKQVWPDIKEYMQGAADYTYGRYDVDDILESITDYDHVLWIAFNEEGIKGAVVSSFVDYPRKRMLCMQFCGGIEVTTWQGPMLELLQRWSKDNDCDGIESTGRVGWSKVFKSDGYKPLWQTYELPVDVQVEERKYG